MAKRGYEWDKTTETRTTSASRKALVPPREEEDDGYTTSYVGLADSVQYEFRIAPIDFASLKTNDFHSTLCGRIDEMRKNNVQTGLIIYRHILPGLEDARRRFAAGEKVNGCEGIEAYIESLGLKPGTVRQWKHRQAEAELLRRSQQLTGETTRPRKRMVTNKEDETPKSESKVVHELCDKTTKLHEEPEVGQFGIVMWGEDDIAYALENSNIDATPENVAAIRKHPRLSEIEDEMREAGWHVIYTIMDELGLRPSEGVES